MTAADARRVLVTGGTGAIGGAVVERLRADGADVVFTGRNRARGEALASQTGARFIAGDVREQGTVAELVEEALVVLGGLDGLVLASGVLHRAALSETTDIAWDAVIETNVVAPFLFARACLPALSDGGGAIVAVVSGAADWPEVGLGAYSVSNRALLWMTRMLAVEGATRGVRANAVCPGHTSMGMRSSVDGVELETLASPPLPPSGTHTTVTEVADAVAYLLSEAASGSTGAALSVDGGMLAALRADRVRR